MQDETKNIQSIMKKMIKKDYFKIFLTLMTIPLISILIGIYLFINHKIEFNPLFVFIPLAILFLFFGFIFFKARKVFFTEYAKKIGFSFQGSEVSTEFTGSLFNNGHSRRATNLIKGIILNNPTKIFDYTYTIGQGKNRTTYHFDVLEIQSSQHLPIFTLKEKSGFLNFAPNIDVEKNGTKLNLEGDFSKYFNLEVEKEFEIEVLQIFTPEFMADLCEHFKHLSIETTENRIYIYENKLIQNTDDLDLIVFLAKKIIRKIEMLGNSLSKDVLSLRDIINKKS